MIAAAWIEGVLEAAALLRRARATERSFGGATQDSRGIAGGELFVALPGERTDGHRYVAEALHSGAAGALISDADLFDDLAAAHAGAALWLVTDPLAALQTLARARLRSLGPTVIGITGSNGKTGTKDLCHALCATIAPSFASAGNYNNLIGLPLTLMSLPADTEFAILEMGCSSFGEIEELCDLFAPRIGVVTNIGAAHLDRLGDLAGVARAKGELPASLPADGLCVLPAADPFTPELAARSRARILSFGTGEDCDLRVEDRGLAGPSARRVRVEGREFTLPRPARHQLLSLAAAWAVARDLGGEPGQMAAAVEGLRDPGNRGAVYRLGPWTLVDDSYNANPASLRAALNGLAEIPAAGRRWAVLGDMLELGEQSEELHAICGREAARSGIDGLLATGPICRHLVAAARAEGLALARHFAKREDLAAALNALLREGDLVLLKGSRGMAMEGVLESLEQSLGQERELMI